MHFVRCDWFDVLTTSECVLENLVRFVPVKELDTFGRVPFFEEG